MTLQDEQAPIDRAICDAMGSSTPDHWTVIVLHLERYSDSKVGEVSLQLSSPEGYPPVMPDAALFEAVAQLDELFDRYGRRFTRATYRVELLADSWKWQVELNHEPPRPNPRPTGRST